MNRRLRHFVAPLVGVLALASALVAPSAGALSIRASVPAAVSGTTAVSVVAGYQHTCALLKGGRVKCWGLNADGQLGIGDKSSDRGVIGNQSNEMGDYVTTVDLGTGRVAKAVAAGGATTCALLDSGRVKCWGSNSSGQVGIGDSSGSNARIGDSPNEMGNNLPTVNLGTGRRAKAIAVGGYHACALLDNGTVKCWGQNNYGQLGQGDMVNRGNSLADGHRLGDDLTPVSLGRKAKAIIAGSYHTCAILDNNTLKCWGYNGEAQLGIGSLAGDNLSIGDQPGEMNALQPVKVGANRKVKAVSAGYDFTCALLDNGAVKCWGSNYYGASGLGNTDGDNLRIGDQVGEVAALPPVPLGRKAKAIAGADSAPCALLDNNTVKCWGYNGDGAAGSGTNVGDNANIGDQAGEVAALQPINLGVGLTAKAVTASAQVCVLLNNGTIKCWGWNGEGELGYGDTANRGDDEPVASLPSVNLGVRVRSIASAQFHTCAILENRSVQCWGWNGEGYGEKGALGLGDSLNRGDNAGEMGDSLPRVDLGTGRTAKSLGAGPAYEHTCAVLDNNTLKCWGDNSEGQLGLGNTVDRGDSGDVGHELGDGLPAVALGVGRTARAVALGEAHTCALLDNGTVKCWGRNDQGQLGNGNNAGENQKIGDQAGETAALVPVVLGRKAKAIAAGGNFTCALLDNGTVKCWGDNSSGQLGQGDKTGERVKIGDQAGEVAALSPVALGRKAKAIVAGFDHACALLDNGSVKCWGDNAKGQLGQGDTANRGDDADEMGADLPPVDLGAGRTAKALAAGDWVTCALLDNGTMKCWGYNHEGQLGQGDTANRGDDADEMGDYLPAIPVGGSRRVLAMSVGYFTCALLDDYSVRCWGYDSEGQHGQGDTVQRGDEPNEMGVNLKPVPLTG